jgi:hypothetical protein
MDPKRDEISKFSFSAGYPWIEQEPGQHLRIVLQQLRRIISGMPSSRLLANESSGCGKFRILGMHAMSTAGKCSGRTFELVLGSNQTS